VVWSFAAWLVFIQWAPEGTAALYPVVIAVTTLVGTYFYWRVLQNWRHRMQAGERLWFQRWRGSTIAAVLGVLACIYSAVPIFAHAVNPNTTPFVLLLPKFIQFANAALIIGCLLFIAGMWLWWCDSTPRSSRALTIAALAWLVVATIPWSIVQFVQLDIYSYDPSTFTPDTSSQLVVWNAHRGAYSGLWILRAGSMGHVFPQQVGLTFLISLFAIALAKLAYLQLKHRRRTLNVRIEGN
jgi:hypothetical protein